MTVLIYRQTVVYAKKVVIYLKLYKTELTELLVVRCICYICR